VSAVGSKAIPVMTNTNFLPYKSATVPPIKPPRVPPMIDAVTKPECCNGLFKGGAGRKANVKLCHKWLNNENKVVSFIILIAETLFLLESPQAKMSGYAVHTEHGIRSFDSSHESSDESY
jgi:hypothetical protein